MSSSLRLNAKFFPVLALLAWIMQLLDPSRVWVILLIGVGGAWLVCRWWVRGLQLLIPSLTRRDLKLQKPSPKE